MKIKAGDVVLVLNYMETPVAVQIKKISFPTNNECSKKGGNNHDDSSESLDNFLTITHWGNLFPVITEYSEIQLLATLEMRKGGIEFSKPKKEKGYKC